MGRRFGKKSSEPKGPKWEQAPEEVIKMLARVADEKFPNKGLAEAGFAVLMKRGMSRKGKMIKANIKLMSSEERYETGKTFRLNINSVTWEKDEYAQREYTLAEQLSRCAKAYTESGETRWYIADYEVQVNPEMVRLYGLATPELKELHKALMQTELGMDDEVEEKAEGDLFKEGDDEGGSAPEGDLDGLPLTQPA